MSLQKPYLKHTSYLAIELAEDQTESTLRALSPKIMRWNETIWLLDLASCASYWHHRATMAQLTVPDFFTNLLRDLCGETYRGVFARHPWQALLILVEMKERQLDGLLLGESPFAQALLHDLSWTSWWECLSAIVPHFDKSQRRHWNPSIFQRQCRDMRRAVERLGLPSAGYLRSIPAPAITRRFGAVLGELRDWTYESTGVKPEDPQAPKMRLLFEEEKIPFTSGFPWQSLTFVQSPTIVRHLETPLREWDHIEPLLRDDFDRLCLLNSWSQGERIVSLEWRLTLSDLTPLTLPLRFRHPHPLHAEQGSHKTALLQALYAFEGLQKERRKRPHLRDGYEPIPALFAITSWELCLTERLTLPRQSTSFFGDESLVEEGDPHPARHLLRLENKLSIPLTGFDIYPDWLPEDSFAPILQDSFSRTKDSDALTTYAHGLASTVLSKARPLFLYREPEPLDERATTRITTFNERTMHKWWDISEKKPAIIEKVLQRDYYRMLDRQHRCLWVYRDSLGQYFIHGIY